MRNRLPYIDLTNWLGLYTKGSNEVLQDTQLRVAKNTDFFTQYGSVSKPRGSSRILDAVYTESGSTQPLSWVGFYKAADLDGQILRHTLIAAGTTIQRVESDGTLTALTGSGKSITESRTSGLFHDSATFGDFLFITNQDPDLVGNGNTLVKYNGAEILRWGLVAPGSQATVQEAFDSTSGWGTITGGTFSTDSVTTQDGTSIKIDDITGTAELTKTLGSTFSVSTAVTNRARVFIYIPRGQIENIAVSQAFQVFVGSDNNLVSNFYRFDFDIGDLQEGWNEKFLDFSSPTATVGSPVATALKTVSFQVNARSGQELDGIRLDEFVSFDTGTPTIASGAAGSVFSATSVYKYVVTFISKTGHESNAGPESASFTVPAGGLANISLSDIPTSTDNQTIARRIYRTVANGSVFLFVDSIEDNTTTTFSDTISDTALGSTQPPFEGDVSLDHTPPPQAGIVKVWKRTVFMAGKPDDPFSIFYSIDDNGEAFPTLNKATLDSKITGMYESYSGLVVETELGKWQVTGDNPDFRFDKIINNMGCVGRRAAGETRIQGWSIDRDGMRLYDLNNPVKISESIRDKFDDDFNKTNIELLHSEHCKCNNTILMFVADANGDYTSNNFIYQYPVDEIIKGWWWQLDLPSSVNVQHVKEREDANGDFEIVAAADDGMLYKLFDSSSKNWATATSSEAITTELQTKWFRLGELGAEAEGHTGRVEPRLLEVRHSGDQTTWTVTVETANGSSQDTATDSTTVTLPFAGNSNNESLLRYPVKQVQPGEYVRLTFTNSDADVSSTILGIRLYFHVQPGQFPVETGDMNDLV